MRRFVFLVLMLCLVACAQEEGSDTSSDELPPDGIDDTFVAENVGKADAKGIEEHSFDGICVLRLVNTAPEEVLKESVHRLAAREIHAYRSGVDAVFGTADDAAFETLDELDDVSWVGFFAFRGLKNYARDNSYCPELTEETIMPGEEAAIEAVSRKSESFVRETYATERPARRDAHAKEHGCVKAFFEVDNSNLSEKERVGVFAQNQTFESWIRFSNGSFHVQEDVEADVRGMAIKLMGVAGEKVLEKERDAQTQDFLLINGSTMFVRNPIDYVEFTEKALDGNPVSYFLSLDPREWNLRELFNLLSAVRKEPSNPLTSRYWSTTPYLMGSEGAVKFSAKPCDGEKDGQPDDASTNYLREAMGETLARESVCFEFMVQFQTNPESMPIEDPTYEWDEFESPFITVAKIQIPSQSFDSEAQEAFCEHLSFTPWHTLPEHRPLGGINRVRRLVYENISSVRHELNGVPREEPKSHSIP